MLYAEGYDHTMSPLAIIVIVAVVAVIAFTAGIVGMGAGIAYAALHPDKVIPDYQKPTTPHDALLAARVADVKKLCESSIEFDKEDGAGGLTNRAWLASSIINVLDGAIDKQLLEELP